MVVVEGTVEMVEVVEEDIAMGALVLVYQVKVIVGEMEPVLARVRVVVVVWWCWCSWW